MEIKGDKVGLSTWGYTASGVGLTEDSIRYYYSNSIPREFRNHDQLFKVELGLKGLIFKKIQLNGDEDFSERPFQILNQP